MAHDKVFFQGTLTAFKQLLFKKIDRVCVSIRFKLLVWFKLICHSHHILLPKREPYKGPALNWCTCTNSCAPKSAKREPIWWTSRARNWSSHGARNWSTTRSRNSSMLKTFKDAWDLLKSGTIPFHEIVSDKSFENFNAVLKVLNKMTMTEYLQLCWDILNGNQNFEPYRESLVVLRLCSSHTTANMSKRIREFFPLNKDWKLRTKVNEVIGLLFGITNIDSAKELLAHFLALFSLSVTKYAKYCAASDYVSRVVNLGSTIEWGDFETEPQFAECKDGDDSDDNEGSGSTSIYANSPFFKLANKIVSELLI